jgi:phosphoglycolate phosphatase
MNRAMLHKPKAIFFDWDGTLVDSYAALEESHNRVLQSYGEVPQKPGWFRQYFGGEREVLYPAIYGTARAHDARRKFEHVFGTYHCEWITLLDGVEEGLSFLDNLNMPYGVVTNKHPKFVTKEIAHFGWTERFVSLVGAREAANDKPSPAPLLLAIERAGLRAQPEEVLFVGDTAADLACAAAAGSPCVFIGDEHSPHLNGYTPLTIVPNIRALKDILHAA